MLDLQSLVLAKILTLNQGDLNHRKLTYDCAAPASTPFDVAIGPMANSAGAPKIASLRTIKSDVVVGLGEQGDELAEKLDKEEPGWKISGKYVSLAPGSIHSMRAHLPSGRCLAFGGTSWREGSLRLGQSAVI